MAEVTWKHTLVGSFVLFLMGLIIATIISYANVAVVSIQAALDGPFDCIFAYRTSTALQCKESYNMTATYLELQECVYVFVNFTSKDGVTTSDIKLSMSYRESTLPSPLDNRTRQEENGDIRIGKCSANYCGTYRFKDPVTHQYKNHPELIQVLHETLARNSSIFPCFLNTNDPKQGAYLHLNLNMKNAEQRIFRYYEAWIVLMIPPLVAVMVVIWLCALFIKGCLRASPIIRQPTQYY